MTPEEIREQNRRAITRYLDRRRSRPAVTTPRRWPKRRKKAEDEDRKPEQPGLFEESDR